MIRVVVADDHAIVRTGLRYTFEDAAGIDLVAEVDDGERIVEVLNATPADVLIFDLNMPGIVSPSARVQTILAAHPDLHIVVYSAHSDRDLARLLIQAGARGVVPKSDSNQVLIEVIERVMAGELCIAPSLAGTPESDPTHEPLTPREAEVLDQLGQGFTPKEIAERMDISLGTVRTHLRNAYPKVGVERLSQAALYAARQRGLFSAVNPDPDAPPHE